MRLELPENLAGRDFVVSDIHGHFALLDAELVARNFDPARDRVVAVGDLVDRGPQSPRALEFLAQPWFFSVRGNHEQAMLDWLAPLLADATPAEVRDAAGRHMAIGGDWSLPLLTAALRGPRDDVLRWKVALDALPIAILIPRNGRRTGVVHATVPGGDWNVFERIDQLNASGAQQAMWSRRPLDDMSDASPGVANIDEVFAGHNVVRSPQQLGNFHMIETGAWAGNVLTIAEVGIWPDADGGSGKSRLRRWFGR